MGNKLNFTLSELIHSDTALKNNINNMPDIVALDNLLNLIFYCLQPIRDKLNKPMIITSGYRSKALNSLVGGVSSSQHLKGQAADFCVPSMSVGDVISFMRTCNIEYDQLINEYERWVHISYVKGKNRKSIIKLH